MGEAGERIGGEKKCWGRAERPSYVRSALGVYLWRALVFTAMSFSRFYLAHRLNLIFMHVADICVVHLWRKDVKKKHDAKQRWSVKWA